MTLAATLAGCGAASRTEVLPVELPAELPGGYKLDSARALPAPEAPESARNLGLRSARVAQYSGPASLQVTVYEMTTGAGAFELVQKWKPEAGKLHFSQGPYFVLVESRTVPVNQLQTFASALDAALKQESPHR